jgi:very-short-patch-repair endonuclease
MARRQTISGFSRRTARGLRHNTTDAERKLWRALRMVETKGSHFRRQVPIGIYVADFACLAARLVVEIDGSQHGEEEGRLRDDKRTRWLESEGYRVIRFWNNDITQNPDGVLDVIYTALYGSRDAEPRPMKHERKRIGIADAVHPTPARSARRPSPSRGG